MVKLLDLINFKAGAIVGLVSLAGLGVWKGIDLINNFYSLEEPPYTFSIAYDKRFDKIHLTLENNKEILIHYNGRDNETYVSPELRTKGIRGNIKIVRE